MSGSNVSELKRVRLLLEARLRQKAGDKISFFGQEYEVAGKLEETGTSYDNCAFMNFETAYTLFDSFQIKYVTDLTEPQKYVSLLTIRTKDGADPKEVANTINTKMRDSGLKAYTAKSNVRKSFRYTGTDAVLQRASDRTVVFNGSLGTDLHF